MEPDAELLPMHKLWQACRHATRTATTGSHVTAVRRAGQLDRISRSQELDDG